MAQKKTPHVGDGSAFGIAVHSQANDPKVDFFAADYQTNFISKRTRLQPAVARTVALLAFGSAAQ